MSFTEAVRTGFQKYATFAGRARPSEYWWWVFFYFLVVLACGLIAIPAANNDPQQVYPIMWIPLLVLITPSLAVFVRRLHDTGRSGAWWFVGLIPLCRRRRPLGVLGLGGRPGQNRYGPPPGIEFSPLR